MSHYDGELRDMTLEQIKVHFESLYDKELWELDIIESQTVATPRINGSIELKNNLYSKDNNIYVNVSCFDSDKYYLSYPMYTVQIEKYNQLVDNAYKFKKKYNSIKPAKLK